MSRKMSKVEFLNWCHLHQIDLAAEGIFIEGASTAPGAICMVQEPKGCRWTWYRVSDSGVPEEMSSTPELEAFGALATQVRYRIEQREGRQAISTIRELAQWASEHDALDMPLRTASKRLLVPLSFRVLSGRLYFG